MPPAEPPLELEEGWWAPLASNQRPADCEFSWGLYLVVPGRASRVQQARPWLDWHSRGQRGTVVHCRQSCRHLARPPFDHRSLGRPLSELYGLANRIACFLARRVQKLADPTRPLPHWIQTIDCHASSSTRHPRSGDCQWCHDITGCAARNWRRPCGCPRRCCSRRRQVSAGWTPRRPSRRPASSRLA
jgi:hypothetical protein